jgi:hypothetical protein
MGALFCSLAEISVWRRMADSERTSCEVADVLPEADIGFLSDLRGSC